VRYVLIRNLRLLPLGIALRSSPLMGAPEPTSDFATLSKRAARRLIQRAFVLAGRDRVVRQHIREANLSTRWVLEDWDLEWTLILDRGKLDFERRPAKRADLVLTWSSASAFFREVQNATRSRGGLAASAGQDGQAPTTKLNGDIRFVKILEPVYFSFCAALREVLANPVDENGDPLV
jgi:hypothetical protein